MQDTVTASQGTELGREGWTVDLGNKPRTTSQRRESPISFLTVRKNQFMYNETLPCIFHFPQ